MDKTENFSSRETQIAAPADTTPITAPAVLKQTGYDGTLLKERYLIEGELGRGGIGVVYLARDTQLRNRRVVVKVLLQESNDSLHSPWFKKKFEQEIEALIRLDHPGIVGVLDVGALPDGKQYFVMQYVEGQSLRSSVKGQMDFAKVARVIRQIGQALSSAHDKGIIHRDLKPENIMVHHTTDEDDEIIKLIDFGIATVRDSQAGENAEQTKIVGALPYMAPEQLRGQPDVSTDIWALGAMAYEMLTGRLPFQAVTMVQLYEAQKSGLHLKPRSLRPDLPVAAEDAILKALAFDPAQRYARAKDFGDELARVLTGAERPVTASHSDMTTPERRGSFDTSANKASETESFHSAQTQVGGRPAKPPEAYPPAIGAQTSVADRASEELQSPASPQPDGPQPASPRPDSKAESFKSAQAVEAKSKSPAGKYAIAAALLLAVVAVAAWMAMNRLPSSQLSPLTPGAPAAPAIARQLSYSLRVLQNPAKNPGKPPVPLAGEIVFTPGDQLCLNFNSLQDGYLYIVNEGPQPNNGLPAYNLLFPDPEKVAANSPSLEARQQLFIPSEQPPWFPVDQDKGTETLWVIWSDHSIAELEVAKRWLNPKDGGEIKDAGEIKSIQQFINKYYPATKPVAEKDEQTNLKGGKDGLIIYPLKLAHT